MIANSRCWELTDIDKPPALLERHIGRPGPDEVLIKIDACASWCADVSYSYGGMHAKHQRSPKPRHRVCGHVVEAGANALYFTDRAVAVPVVAPRGQDAARWFGTAMLCLTREVPGNEFDGEADCMIVPMRHLRILEDDLPGANAGRAGLTSVLSDASNGSIRLCQ